MRRIILLLLHIIYIIDNIIAINLLCVWTYYFFIIYMAPNFPKEKAKGYIDPKVNQTNITTFL